MKYDLIDDAELEYIFNLVLQWSRTVLEMNSPRRGAKRKQARFMIHNVITPEDFEDDDLYRSQSQSEALEISPSKSKSAHNIVQSSTAQSDFNSQNSETLISSLLNPRQAQINRYDNADNSDVFGSQAWPVSQSTLVSGSQNLKVWTPLQSRKPLVPKEMTPQPSKTQTLQFEWRTCTPGNPSGSTKKWTRCTGTKKPKSTDATKENQTPCSNKRQRR